MGNLYVPVEVHARNDNSDEEARRASSHYHRRVREHAARPRATSRRDDGDEIPTENKFT